MFWCLRGAWRLGHVSAGVSRAAKPTSPTTPWTNHNERHTEPLLCCRLRSWPLDLPQQGRLPAGHRLLLCLAERSHSQTFGKTLVYPHHAIQDLQVIHFSLCLIDCGTPFVTCCYPKVCIYCFFLFPLFLSPTPSPAHSLSVDSSKDLSLWLDTLSSSIRSALSSNQVALRLWENPSNKVCGDCGAANPEWASVNLLLVICQACAGTRLTGANGG